MDQLNMDQLYTCSQNFFDEQVKKYLFACFLADEQVKKILDHKFFLADEQVEKKYLYTCFSKGGTRGARRLVGIARRRRSRIRCERGAIPDGRRAARRGAELSFPDFVVPVTVGTTRAFFGGGNKKIGVYENE
jgi:hypothetical protein